MTALTLSLITVAVAADPPKILPPVRYRGPEVKISESFNTGSTGYMLALTRLGEGLHVVYTEDKGPAQPIPGAPSERTFVLLASKPQSEITLSHFQPWMPDGMNSSRLPVTVELTEPMGNNKPEVRTLHVEPDGQFQIKVGEFPQYLMILQAMSEGIYLIRTEHEDPADPVPGAYGSRIFHMYAARNFKSGKVTICYHVPGTPAEDRTVEYIIRTADAKFDRLGVTSRATSDANGIEIVTVANGSTADDYRLQPGDVILSVNAEDTNAVDTYHKLLNGPGPFFHVRGRYKNGKPFEFTCNLPASAPQPQP